MGEPIDAIETRLGLIHAALKKTTLVKFEHGKEEIGGGGYRMRFPFDEQPTAAELVVNVYAVIGALANLKDLLKTSAKEHGREPQRVEDFVKTRTDLQLVLDLNNAHKHAYPPTRRHSGRDPKFSWIRAATETRSDGVGSIRTDIVIIGEVVDGHDAFICRMDHLFEGAIGAWEELLKEFGVSVPAP